ncbi:hypothetical protein SLEP1_g48107 [Rubroshorea leprosula]|uniref:Uncharacterized protein n=1 Tax=Rubroshorea leprosula TaxID=152421 RepID=A0AAV5LSK6_9ROSI|nr:hypothetical protein SLEP1_g48107 [Rubroshorea leprosula]
MGSNEPRLKEPSWVRLGSSNLVLGSLNPGNLRSVDLGLADLGSSNPALGSKESRTPLGFERTQEDEPRRPPEFVRTQKDAWLPGFERTREQNMRREVHGDDRARNPDLHLTQALRRDFQKYAAGEGKILDCYGAGVPLFTAIAHISRTGGMEIYLVTSIMWSQP